MSILNIPADKVTHFGVGLIASLFAALLWWLLSELGAVSMSSAWAGVLTASLVAGITKEAADYLDNRATKTQMHGVEVLDALATAAGAAPVAALLFLNF